ncbi:MAG: hypothetical protein KME26_20745 [Oscillatoria princeps RMCB-10]|nr:hypothetical protein [Oscillatoria princeps RMCB-10]
MRSPAQAEPGWWREEPTPDCRFGLNAPPAGCRSGNIPSKCCFQVKNEVIAFFILCEVLRNPVSLRNRVSGAYFI